MNDEKKVKEIQYKPSKKIFFLYPVSVVYDLVKDLIRLGYEVYVLNDHKNCIDILAKYPGSIIYVNIFEKMNKEEWEGFIRLLMSSEKLKEIQVGVCVYSTSEDEELSKKYLIDYGITGGYINLYISYKKSLESIRKILEASEAKGSRKFVRVSPFDNDDSTFIVVNLDGKIIRGKIIDISVFCIAAKFDAHYFVQNQILRRASIKLRGVFCSSDLIVKGFHRDKNNVYVLIFVNTKDEVKNKIFDYIYERLQTEVQNC